MAEANQHSKTRPFPAVFGPLSIKRKLVLLIMLVSSTAMLFSGGAWLSYEWFAFRQRMADDLSSVAAMLAENCSAALAFEDPQDATKVLDSLNRKKNIEYCAVYTKNDELFATFQRGLLTPPSLLPAYQFNDYRFNKDSLLVWQNINLANKKIGTLVLQSNLQELKDFLNNSLTALLAMISLTLLVALFWAARLQKIITGPLYHLADMAELITRRKDYSVRAIKQSEDEVGILTDSFNNMLAQVERRDLALRESQERLRSVIEHAPVIIWVLNCEGVFTFIEGRALKPLGREPEDLMGKSIFELFSDNPDIITSARMALNGAAISASFMINKISYDIRYVPILDDQKQITGAIGVGIDITKQKKALDESLRLFSAIEHAAEDIFITSPDGVIEYVNPAFERITGFSRSEAIGKTPRILQSGLQDEKFYQKMWDTINNKQVWTGRIINRKKDGSLIHEDATISPIFDSSGRGIGFVSVKRDVTEQLKTEEMLRQSQKMEAIGTLAGGIAHDFNNILSAIFGFTEMAMLRMSHEAKEYGDLNKVLTAAERARDLVKQILTFSRMREVKPLPVQVQNIAKETLKLLKATLPSTIKIKQDFRSHSMIMADPTQIHQVMMNLFTNAAHAMRERGGVLEVRLGEVAIDEFAVNSHKDVTPGNYLKLTVSDSGHGMPAEVRDRIFDPFFTTKKEGEGTGMGLSVVHGIVHSFGGFITVYSEPEAGTTFHVFFPILKQMEDIKNVTLEPLPGGHEHILFVDDEEPLIESGQNMLEYLGYKVTAFSDSTDALRAFTNDPTIFDLIITDITMPNLAGDILTKKILAIRPDLPIILCTGYHSEFTEEKAKDIGACKLATKPIVQKDMALLVRHALDRTLNN